MREHLLKFHESFAEELRAKKNRVRDLIGDANWGEDGRYKEVLFRDVIQQYIPDPYYVNTGFFISNDGRVSKQLDIIVRNGMIPVYFREGDFAVLPKQAVIGFIEVKTRIRSLRDFEDILHKYKNIYSRSVAYSGFSAVDKLEHDSNQGGRREIRFKGLFAYDLDESINLDADTSLQRLKSMLASSEVAFDHVVLGQKYFIKFWPEREQYCIYKLQSLSYTYFLSNLLKILSEYSHISFREQWAFRYPIPGGKDSRLLGCVGKD